MSKFKVKIHRIDEYIIDIDDAIWTEKALESYSKYMSDVSDLEDVARLVAIDQMTLDMTTKNGVDINIISEMDYDFKITEIDG
jgi:hypothetical protein